MKCYSNVCQNSNSDKEVDWLKRGGFSYGEGRSTAGVEAAEMR